MLLPINDISTLRAGIDKLHSMLDACDTTEDLDKTYSYYVILMKQLKLNKLDEVVIMLTNIMQLYTIKCLVTMPKRRKDDK